MLFASDQWLVEAKNARDKVYILVDNGKYCVPAYMQPCDARLLAAELIRLADEIEAKS